MKKQNVHKLLYAISLLLLVGFGITFGIDAYKYTNKIYIGSAPLDVYLLVRVIEFVVPSVIVFVVATIVRKKLANKERRK